MRTKIFETFNASCLTLFFILGFVINGASQNNPFRFFEEEKTFIYGLNNRRTSLLDETATIYGAHIGLKFGNRLKHTLTLNSNLFWVGNREINPDEFKQVRLFYIGFSEEFELFQFKKISFNSYVHLGVGKTYYRSINNEIPLENSFTSNYVLPLEAGLHTEYKLNSWASLKIGGGYRYVACASEHPINGPYFKVGAGLNLKAFLAWSKEIKPVIELIKTFGAIPTII